MPSANLFDSFPTLTSPTLVLRKITAQDIEEIYALYSNARIFEFCGIFNKYNKAVLLKDISHYERNFVKKKRIKWGIALNDGTGKVIGIIETMDYKIRASQVTIGYFLHPDYWHKGYATEAVRILVHYLFAEVGLQRIDAEVLLANLHSKQVLLKNGFQLERVMLQEKQWPSKGLVDLELYSLTAADYHS